MNKKIFTKALLAVAALVFSTVASAAITYSTSVGVGGQTDNAVVTSGGGSVRANDLIIIDPNATPIIAADDEIIVRLPAGINFDGSPSYLVTRAGGGSATTGLTLKDGTVNGDPTLDEPGIALSDTNGDGGMDRALVTVSSDSKAGDSLTISINVTAGADVTDGVYEASVIVSGNLAVTQDIVEVISADIDPFGLTDDSTEVSQALNTDVDTSATTFAVTIPANTAGGKTITLTPLSGVSWGTTASGSSITWTVHTPFAVDPLTPTSTSGLAVGPQSATTAVTLTTNWASTATNADPIVVNFTIDTANSLAGATGLRKVGIAGTAGVAGNIALFNALANGSDSSLSAKPTAPSIVAGSSAPQTLPTINVEENFDLDVGASFTITAGTGLTFVSGGSISTSGISGSISVNATSTVITVTVGTNTGGSDTLTISGITGIADLDASGSLSVTVDSETLYGPKDDVLTVATAVPVGSVSVSVSSKQVKDVGPDGYSATSVITLEESTYGSITTANATSTGISSQDAYFRLTPTNANITAIAISDTGYAAGTSPTIAVTTACYDEAAPVTSGAWICEVEGESTAVVPGTSTVSVSVTYTTDDASVGDNVTIAIDGNSAVEGEVTVANVEISTTADVTGVIPDIDPGDLSATSLGTLVITENFANAIDAGGTKSIRIIAPAGVSFQDAASVNSAVVGTATITATFNPNDTLIVQVASDTITVNAKAIIADGLSGLQTFSIVDGDIDGLNGAGVTTETVELAYAGLLDAVDAGDDGDVNVGFTVSNATAGGLAPYTATSSSDATATASVSGSTVTVEGVAAGAATITVTDALGASDTYAVTVSVGATIPNAVNAVKGADGRTGASFLTGASSDGGATYTDTFTTADDITIVATVNVDAVDQGLNGAIHVAIKSDNTDGVSLSYLDEDSVFMTWDPAGLPGAHIVAEPLAASYNVTIYSGTFAAGTYRIALAYTNENDDIVYTGKAIEITVTE